MISSRRAVLAILIAAGVSPEIAFAQPGLRMRHNVSSALGVAMLGRYAEAVRRMRSLGPADPRSWLFQWYVHAVPNKPGKAQMLATVFGAAPSAQRALAERVWSSCEPHFSGEANLFLPWHRLYVLGLEAIVRQLLDDPAFTLPYWDYTEDGARSIPRQFRKDAGAQWAPLLQANRRADRTVDINAGDPMDKGASVSPYDRRSMERSIYEGGTGFCTTLDQTLHGNVHVGVGDSTNMGSVPTAAGDPIFWLHHCNVDRIWAGWNQSGGRNPTFSGKFELVDAGGAASDIPVANAFTTAGLGYSYDDLPSLPPRRQISAATSATEPETVGRSTAPISLGTGVTRVLIRPTGEIGSSVLAGEDDDRVLVVLDGLDARSDPATLYELFVDLPNGAGRAERRRRYIGTFGFFGRVGGHAHGGGPSFDVTDSIRSLARDGKLRAQTVITVEPVGTPAPDAAPIVSRIEVVRL